MVCFGEHTHSCCHKRVGLGLRFAAVALLDFSSQAGVHLYLFARTGLGEENHLRPWLS